MRKLWLFEVEIKVCLYCGKVNGSQSKRQWRFVVVIPSAGNGNVGRCERGEIRPMHTDI